MASALADVLEDQALKARRRAEASKPMAWRTGPLLLGALAFLSALSVYLWFGNPAWLEPAAPEPQSPAVQDAGLRMEVYLQALRVEEFLKEEGRLPNSLEEAGDPFTQVSYERLDRERYRMSLAGPDFDLTVTYLSTEPLDEFLGNASRVIREGGV